MTNYQRFPEEKPRSKIRWQNTEEALKLFESWLVADDEEDDPEGWEDLKKALNQNRQPGRKLFTDV